MSGWPTEEAVRRGTQVLEEAGVALAETDYCQALVATLLATVGLPPVVGNTAAAEILGTDRSNLGKFRDLPKPVYDKPDAPARLWLREDIERLAREREEQGTVRLAGKRPGGEPILERVRR